MSFFVAVRRDPPPHSAGDARPGDLRGRRRPAQGPHRYPDPAPVTPDQAPPPDLGQIPLTVHEIRRLLTAATQRHHPPGHTARWLHWRRRHQARFRWFHMRARLNRDYALVS